MAGYEGVPAGPIKSGLLGDFAFGLVGGVFDFGVEAFEEALEESLGVRVLLL